MLDASLPVSFEQELESIQRVYEERGLGHRVGFGERPAIVVVDLIRGFTSGDSPLGADVPDTIAANLRLLTAGRDARVPVFFSTCHYVPEAETWCAKIPSQRSLEPESPWVEVDPRLAPRANETVFVKHFASCFFGTSLREQLTEQKIDTVIVTGMTTSGCVRATVVDGVSAGFRPIIPREAVADRARLPHLASLFDIDAKYGDVVALDAVVTYLGALADRAV